MPVVNNEKHKTVKAYLWMVRSVMKPLVYFHYDKGSRAQKVVVELLKGFQGAIQTDGYEAYSIYEQKQGVLLLGCWAHARRKFEESLAEDKAGAEYALAQIGKLYQVETMANEQGVDDKQRAELRKRLAYPIMVAFEKWIVKYYPTALPKSRMGRAGSVVVDAAFLAFRPSRGVVTCAACLCRFESCCGSKQLVFIVINMSPTYPDEIKGIRFHLRSRAGQGV